MNAVTKIESPKASLTAGNNVSAIVPQSVEEAFRLANIFHKSGMVPASLKTPEQVMVAMMAGAELGMVPFQAVRHIAVVNGRPTLWGDGLVAVARSQGVQIEETVTGEDAAAVATCKVTRPDTGEIITRSFSAADAKKAGLWGKQGPWQQYPKRMLSMRARAFALRDGAADILNGFQVAEEVQDYAPMRDHTPQTVAVEALQLESTKTAQIEIVDDEPADEVETQPQDEPESVDVDTEDMFPGDRPTQS